MRTVGLLFMVLLFAAHLEVRGQGINPERQAGISSGEVSVYPNPAVDFINIRFESIEVSDIAFSVHNIIGNEMTAETEVLGPHEIRIRVKEYPAGYYLLAVRDKPLNYGTTYKFVKK